MPEPHPGPESADEISRPTAGSFVTVSSVLRRLLHQAEMAAPRLHLATLEGEPGTGKHLFAQTIHRLSHLAPLPFRRRDAREWLANEADISTLPGTLYLDRVDLLGSLGQQLLLNLIKGLKDNHRSPRPFLLLVSAQTSLRQLSSRGAYLPDLAFRLSAAHFGLPPLRQRREDIAPITQALIESICQRYRQPTAVLAQGTLPWLLQYPWPGNVTELASVLECAVLNARNGVIHPADLAFHLSPGGAGFVSPNSVAASKLKTCDDLSLDAAIRRHIQLVLDLNRNNKLRAARQLGISRSTLYRLLANEPDASQMALTS